MKKFAFLIAAVVTLSAFAEEKSSAPPVNSQVKVAKMFVVETHYLVDPAKAAPYKEDHKKWVEKYTDNGEFLYAGPKSDKNGGIIILNGSDQRRVAEIMNEDSFVKEGIVGLKVIEFNPLFSSQK